MSARDCCTPSKKRERSKPIPPIENWWLNALWSVVPTILVGLVFWLVMRAIIRADRAERRAYAEIDAEERARLAAQTENREETEVEDKGIR